MTSAELWPPLALIRRSLTQEYTPVGRADPAPAEPAPPATAAPDLATLLLPLTELARRREALARRAFGTHWASGRLLSVVRGGQRIGVLLDRPQTSHAAPAGGAETHWHGWVAAAEADWAGPFDVLLEPGDEPFEPLLGVVQTWNPVVLAASQGVCSQVQGEVSATRMAALRAVAAQAADSALAPLDVAPQPGRIALREVDGFSVLTGTPLAPQDDPRTAYQALYRDAALPWRTAALTASPTLNGVHAHERRPSLWPRLREWLAPTGPWRPVAVALALVVVVQNVLLQPGPPQEDVRFRDVPALPAEPAASAVDLVVRFQPDAPAAQVVELLRRAGAQVVAGPDAAGGWSLRLLQPRDGQALLQGSPWVSSTQTVP